MSCVEPASGIYSDWYLASDSFENSIIDRLDWPAVRNMNYALQCHEQYSLDVIPELVVIVVRAN